MKTTSEYIDLIKGDLDYTLNNDDYTSSYDHIVQESVLRAYNSDKLADLLTSANISFNPENLIHYWGQFTSDLYQPDFVCSDIEVKNLGYWSDPHDLALVQFSIGEIEIDLDTNESLTDDQIDEIERDADCTICGDYAYVYLEGHCVCYVVCKDYLKDLVSSVNQNLSLEQ